MAWREPKNHVDDCYFCLVRITGIYKKIHSKWTYPDLPSARRHISHSDEVPIPTFHVLHILSNDVEHYSDALGLLDVDDTSDCDYERTSSSHQRFNQNELSDLVRDLSLSKKAAELLASRLNEKNLLDPGTKITLYRKKEQSLLPFFNNEDNLVFCQDVSRFITSNGSISVLLQRLAFVH